MVDCWVPDCYNPGETFDGPGISRCFMHLKTKPPKPVAKKLKRKSPIPRSMHYKKSPKAECAYPECPNRAQLRGLCIKHYMDKDARAMFALVKKMGGRRRGSSDHV